MATAIDTRKVENRQQLHFDSVEVILAHAEQLAKAKEIRCLGNWSAGQIFKHLASAMVMAIDGAPPMIPGFMRFIVRLLFKGPILKKTMSPGFKLPAKAAHLLPPPTSLEEGLQSLRQAVHRFQTETKRAPSPFLGKLTSEEWTKLQCRHAELHLSFLVPA